MKERNPNVEFLRVIMMLLIIMLHLSGELFDIKNIIHQSHSLLVSSIFVIRSFCFLGVSTFAFISGYYGILTSTGKKLIRFEFFALTWGLIFIILDFLFNGFSSVNNLILFLMPTTSGICWYFSSYMLLLIFAPYISFGFEHFDLKINRSIVVVVVLLCYGGSFLFHQNGTSFMLLLYIYIIGRYLRLYPIAKWENNSGSIAYFSIAINALLAFMISYFNIGKGFCLELLENNHNPLLIVSSISLFFLCKKARPSYGFVIRLSSLASYMFAVYIAHVYLLHIRIIDFKNIIFINVFVSLFIYAIALMILCIIVEKIRFFLFNRIENKILDYLKIKFNI